MSRLKNIYLGTEYNNEQVDDAIKKTKLDDSFFFLKNPSAPEIAKWLMSGLVCARFSGRMEFGQCGNSKCAIAICAIIIRNVQLRNAHKCASAECTQNVQVRNVHKRCKCEMHTKWIEAMNDM